MVMNLPISPIQQALTAIHTRIYSLEKGLLFALLVTTGLLTVLSLYVLLRQSRLAGFEPLPAI